MKIALVAHFYPPEPGAGSLRVATFAQALARAGHDVTVVTNFPSFPRGRFAQPQRAISVEGEAPLRVVRLFSVLIPWLPGARLLHWVSSACAATLYLLRCRTKFDTIAISSPPLTLALPGIAGAARHRARLVADLRDVFPDIAIAMGAWKRNGLPARAFEWIARRLYRAADLIVAVTPTAIAQVRQRGVSANALVLAPNAYERAPLVREPIRRRENFTAVYAGNLGIATDVDLLADAAALVADDGITIEIVGDGSDRRRLAQRVARDGLHNLVLTGSLPRDAAMATLAGADVAIVPLRAGIQESVPTKIYDALSVGCPVIVAGEGESLRVGEALGALCTPAGDAPALAGVLRQLAISEKPVLRRLGEKGRTLLEALPDRAAVMDGLVRRIGALAPRRFAAAPLVGNVLERRNLCDVEVVDAKLR